uniref:Uncharacterized protein n=1 Tax=Elsinoe ampelina TaxID=302913 RepID=A0A6A6GN39_9PEZI|nr:hypothetical protein BDZ85DRAFT_316574 [Elsinoe ampelina]
MKIDNENDQDAFDAVKELQTKHSITSLDYVIANAGIVDSSRVATDTAKQIHNLCQVNTVAPILLCRATKPLLQASKRKPVFVALSSAIGSIGKQNELIHYPVDMSPYGPSKAALNRVLHRLHFEEEWLTTATFHPGMPDAVAFGAITPGKSAGDMLSNIDEGTRESIGGKVLQWDGAELPW